MRDFFDKLVAGGEQAVAELITQKFQENVELEFKTKANPNGGELTRDDRKNSGNCAFRVEQFDGWGFNLGNFSCKERRRN
jgi:hypothetical protein